MGLSTSRFLVVFGALAAGAGFLIHDTIGRTAGLRAQAARAEPGAASLSALRAERDRLLALQPSLDELEQLQAASLDLDRDRASWHAYRAELERQLHGRSSPRATPAQDATSPVGAWTNRGDDAPAAVLHTVVWAVRDGHVSELANVIAFDDEAKAEAETFFASLPQDLRTEFGDPRTLVANVMAAKTRLDLTSAELLSEAPSGTDELTVQARLHRQNGSSHAPSLRFRRTADGWRLLVPARVIKGYQALVLGLGPPAPR